MKRKISTKLSIILLIFAISIPIISYAINMPGDKLFLSCDKEETTKGEKIALTLNLDLVEYENFEFTLTSSININNFSTEEKSRNRSKGGMGLGLSIAYNIIELHKGSIKFDKNREKGTRVIVRLPIK